MVALGMCHHTPPLAQLIHMHVPPPTFTDISTYQKQEKDLVSIMKDRPTSVPTRQAQVKGMCGGLGNSLAHVQEACPSMPTQTCPLHSLMPPPSLLKVDHQEEDQDGSI